MIIRGPRPESNYYTLDKRISEDRRLSWASRGLLVFLLGKPDHWQVSITNLVREVEASAKPTGRDATYSLLNELIEVGYIKRVQERKPDGTMGEIQYVVTEQPEASVPASDPGQPLPANPVPVDPTQVIKEEKQGKKKNPPTPQTESGFDRFWSAYPRKVAKAEAAKAWAKIKPDDNLLASILAALDKAKRSPGWRKDNGQFIPHPTTWLNQRRWEDEELAEPEEWVDQFDPKSEFDWSSLDGVKVL